MTDCYLTLGYLDPAGFNDGAMRLDDAGSRAALQRVSAQLDLEDAVAAAVAAVRVASAKMATEIRKLLAQKGLDPRTFTLVAYGGAGPTHANLLAEEARLETVLVPKIPGTFCALGAILADVRRDFTRPARIMIDDHGTNWAAIKALVEDAEAEAAHWIAGEGKIIGEHAFRLTADIRYPAQAFELSIQVADFSAEGFRVGDLIELFHAEHERLYGFRESGSEVQVTNLRLAVIGRVPPITLPQAEPGELPNPVGLRRVHHGDWRDVPVYARGDLGAGAMIDGPALVDQPDSTVWILPDWRGEVDELGNLLIRRVG
jgi:N-methylhydantoinase A